MKARRCEECGGVAGEVERLGVRSVGMRGNGEAVEWRIRGSGGWRGVSWRGGRGSGAYEFDGRVVG